MAALFATRPRDDWAERFLPTDCCVTPILSPEEALRNEQLQARGMIIEGDGLTQFAPPLKLSEYEFTVRQTAPRPGQHNEAILRAAGYAAEDIARLQAGGALG
jgi:crotonobetainyl-CoA:carnitine CoA-transferase CaiB-like acyl-CoA transferase